MFILYQVLMSIIFNSQHLVTCLGLNSYVNEPGFGPRAAGSRAVCLLPHGASWSHLRLGKGGSWEASLTQGRCHASLNAGVIVDVERREGRTQEPSQC